MSVGARPGPGWIVAARRSLWERWTYRWWSAGWRFARSLPEPVVDRVFAAVADMAWARRTGPVRQLEDNLAHVLAAPAGEGPGPAPAPGQARAMARVAMRSYMRYWSEMFRLPDWSPERVRSMVRVDGEEVIDAAIAAGHGIILALPHMANWDLGGAWAGLRGLPVTTVVERVRPERLFQQFLAYRQAFGLEVVPLTGSDTAVLGTLVDRLRHNRLVPLLADRDLLGSGIPVRFFGASARLPPGPALLALRTGAPLVPGGLWYDDAGVRIHLYEPVHDPGVGTTRERVVAMTQQVADAMADAIRAHPTDWHMLQPVWAGEPPTAPRRAVPDPVAGAGSRPSGSPDG